MKKIVVGLVFLVAGFTVWGTAGIAQTAAKAAGHWEGAIQMSNPETGKTRDLGIAVDIAKSSSGEWIGSMSVLGSTAIDVPLSSIILDNTAVRFTARLPEDAAFDGQLSGDANRLSGTASSAAGQAPFQMTRIGEANVKVPPPSSTLSKEFEGTWEGTIEAGGKARRVVLKLSPTPNGIATATLISVDKGNLEIPFTTVTIQDKHLQLEARSVSGKYQGKLAATGEIAGEWTEGSTRLPLTFKRGLSDAKKP